MTTGNGGGSGPRPAPAVTWCSHCGAPVDAGRCTDPKCPLSVKVGALAEYAARVRDLDRLAKSALLDIMARHAREAGARWLIGGPALWSKDELINGILASEYPAPPPAVPADVLTWTEQGNLPEGCHCSYALSSADGRWHLVTRKRCPLHRTVPNDTYGDLTAAELADLRAAAHPCLTCGMLADVDPELHLSRYGHRPKYRDDSGRVLVWFASRWAEKIDEPARTPGPPGDATPAPEFAAGERVLWVAPGRVVVIEAVRWQTWVSLNLPDGWRYDLADPDTGKNLLLSATADELASLPEPEPADMCGQPVGGGACGLAPGHDGRCQPVHVIRGADPEPATAKRRPRLATNATPGYPIGRLQRAEPEPKGDGR